MEVYNSKNNSICNKLNNDDNKHAKDMPVYIQEIVKKLKSASSRTEMYEILDKAVENTSDFICLDDTEFVGNGYRFQCTLKQYTENINKNITLPSGWHLVEVIPIGTSDRAVILTKVAI